MTYNKPEVTVLGVAAEVIQYQLKPGSKGCEVSHYFLAPAYDLDE